MNNTYMNQTNGRHAHWLMAAAFTTIALIAMVQSYEGKLKDQDRTYKWIVSAMSIALTFSALGVFACVLMREKFMSTPLEGGMALVACGFWAAALPAIMDPNNGLAIIDYTGGIANANLYFFSWGGLVASFLTLYGFMKEKCGAKVISPSTWGALCLTSFITMISASRIFQDLPCDKNMPDGTMKDVCRRTAWGVSVGAISAILAATWPLGAMILSGSMVNMIDAGLSLVMLILWVFGIGYITFGGEKSPALVMGNLYFFTWFSFAISVFLFMNSMNLLMNKKEESNVTNATAVVQENALEEKMNQSDNDEAGPDVEA